MPHCTAYFTVSAKPGKYTTHVVQKKTHPKHNSDKVHSLLTHRRNCSYGGRQSRRSTAASSMGFAPGEGSSSACASAAKQPSLPRFLSPALPAPPLCQRYKTDVSTWSGALQEIPTRQWAVKAARVRRGMSERRVWIVYSAAESQCLSFVYLNEILSLWISCFIASSQNLPATESLTHTEERRATQKR